VSTHTQSTNRQEWGWETSCDFNHCSQTVIHLPWSESSTHFTFWKLFTLQRKM